MMSREVASPLAAPTTPEAGRAGAGAAARVVLVEGHGAFREALAVMFDREPGFEVVAQAGTVAEAREQLGGIDLAVVEPDLPDGDGAELIGALRATNPGAAVLVLTASPDRAAHARAVGAGAAGVLHKSVRVGEVVDAARRLVAGEGLLAAEEVGEMAPTSRRYRLPSIHRSAWKVNPRNFGWGLLSELRS
jgi:DNA-binding NarL/FixJ family response regulator